MVKKVLLILCISLIPLAGLCPPINNAQKENITLEAKKRLFYLTVFDKPFSPELLKEAMYYEGIKSPEIVFIQAQIETGHFTSDLFVNANNVFGMRYPRVRDTYSCGEYKHHAEYKTWLSCVKDYALWQKYFAGIGYNLTSYIEFLDKVGYATNKKYIDLIKEMS